MAKYLFVIKNVSSNAGVVTADVDITDASDNTYSLVAVPDAAFGTGLKSNIVQKAVLAFNTQVAAPPTVPLIAQSDLISVFGNPDAGAISQF